MLKETMVLSPELSIYHSSSLFPVFREDSFVFLIWKGSWAHFPTQRVIKSSAEIVCVYEEDFTCISDYLLHQSKNKSSKRVDVSNNAIKLFNSFISTISQAASLRLIANYTCLACISLNLIPKRACTQQGISHFLFVFQICYGEAKMPLHFFVTRTLDTFLCYLQQSGRQQ